MCEIVREILRNEVENSIKSEHRTLGELLHRLV